MEKVVAESFADEIVNLELLNTDRTGNSLVICILLVGFALPRERGDGLELVFSLHSLVVFFAIGSSQV